jgi:hypothetical protein
MKTRIIISLTFTFFTLSTYAQDELSEGMESLVQWMSGEFDSAEQAANDTAYMDISLKMTRIWPEKPNGAWFYVEQAVSTTPDKPYRQRIYFISELEEDRYTSDIYTLKDEPAAVGAWKNPSVFDNLTPFDLQHKKGCTVFLFYDGFQFSGNTNAKSCPSDLRGATYATSEVIITADELRSWDRGYNSADEQVWGAEKGHYKFVKKSAK